LNEDEKQIQSHIDTLRGWINSRPHINCDKDDEFLLRFLRVAKYSQLKAQERLDHYCTVRKSEKEGCIPFFENPNPMTESVINVLDRGYFFRLPGYDDYGAIWLYSNEGAIEPTKEAMLDAIRVSVMASEMLALDPAAQINGLSCISDFSTYTASHAMIYSDDVLKKSSKIFENCFPIRLKKFHLYNTGSLISIIWELCKLFLSKKMMDKMVVHKSPKMDNSVPKRMLPTEMGGTAGSKKELAEAFKQDLMKHRHYLQSLDDIGVDESKRVDEVVGTFRKLNVE